LAKLSENNFFLWAFLRLKHCQIAMIHCLFLEMGRGRQQGIRLKNNQFF
jgi:hypothetical protein